MDFPRFRARVNDYLTHIDRSEAYLARQLGYSTGQFGKWMAGINRMPYEAVLAICEKLELSPLAQTEMMALAGYPLPKWTREIAIERTLAEIGNASEHDAECSVREFPTTFEYMTYFGAAVANAKISIDDITWGVDVPSHSDEEEHAYTQYVQSISAACRRGVTYREVMTFRNSPHYAERAEAILKQNLVRYNLRYFNLDLTQSPSLLSICVIDKRETLIAWYRWPWLPHENEKRISIRQATVVSLFTDYFTTTWQAATPIKDGDRVDWKRFQQAISGEL